MLTQIDDDIQTQISIIDIIVDRPGWRDLRSVAKELERATIYEHKVLHVQLSSQHIEDIVHIPHPGHNSACLTSPAKLASCQSANPTHIKYERNFVLQLVVEGSFYLADLKRTDFQLFGRSVMVMISCVHVTPAVDNVDRFELRPWVDTVEIGD